jgi:hypothetical protein
LRAIASRWAAGYGRRIEAESVRMVVAVVRDLGDRQGEEVDHRVAWHVDADRVDQHDSRDPLRAEEAHLGRDPATDRVADHRDVAQVRLLNEGPIKSG